MDTLTFPHAKLVKIFIKLYFINELWKTKYINEIEKIQLKSIF